MKILYSRFFRTAGFIAAALLMVKAPPLANAAGLLIADGGFGGILEIEEHDVQVTINNGVAVTKVTQVFRNTERRQVEALYTFPVPRGASVSNFSMWIQGQEVVGEVLEKKRAREIYESYKVTRQDPGLLEQVDFKTFEMRIFPIEPEASQRVEITYYQELDADHDWTTFVYPLATVTRPGIDSRARSRLAISFEVKSVVPIVAMESTSHPDDFAIVRYSPTYWHASLETSGGSLDRDVVLAFQTSRARTGVDLVTSRIAGEDGYFCLTFTAGEDLARHNKGQDYVFLLDVSGSMGHDRKLLLSKDSIYAFITELGPEDRFEIMTFNVQPTPGFRELRSATESVKAEGRKWLHGQVARGGTVLNPALGAAYRYADPDRTLNVIVLGDGLTEPRERRDLLQSIKNRPRNVRVFCVGVGNDVNKPLLEQIALESGGLASFISHGDDFERQAKAFRRKLLRPAATDVSLRIQGVDSYEIEPATIPNLYHGTPVRIFGRYSGSGEARVEIRANIEGVELKESVRLVFPSEDTANPEINRMWALRRVEGILNRADAAGSRESVAGEIVRLGETYSIVTEYTSFLVLENDAEYQRWKIARQNLARIGRDRQAHAQLRAELDQIRDRALAGIGPGAPSADPTETVTMVQTASKRSNSPAPRPEAAPQPSGGQSANFGSGPVGPLFLLLLGVGAWISRRLRPLRITRD
jgi:Ca-activated chloride channel homolog